MALTTVKILTQRLGQPDGYYGRMRVLALHLLAVFASAFSFAQSSTAPPAISVRTEPPIPLIEHRDNTQLLQFDFAVKNSGKDTVRLIEIELSVYDANGALVLKKSVNSDGFRPGVEMVAPQLLRPGETIDIFNPFYSFDEHVPTARMEFAFRYVIENSAKEAEINGHRLPMDFDGEQRVNVTPKDYQPKTSLNLPLRGRVLVWDGHDFYSHHRRIPLDADKVRKIGIDGANAERYASDLVIVNDRGAMFHDGGYHKTNYFVYGQPIYAPAAGQVYASRNDIPDNEFEGKRIRTPKLPRGADADLGNFVIIDHGNGEYSVFPHMKPGSVRVKKGDHVLQGEEIGQVGFSGDAIFPHVHYSLLSGPDIYHFEGIPAYFHHVRRILGTQVTEPEETTLDSGDILESVAPLQ